MEAAAECGVHRYAAECPDCGMDEPVSVADLGVGGLVLVAQTENPSDGAAAACAGHFRRVPVPAGVGRQEPVHSAILYAGAALWRGGPERDGSGAQNTDTETAQQAEQNCKSRIKQIKNESTKKAHGKRTAGLLRFDERGDETTKTRACPLRNRPGSKRNTARSED